MEVDVEPVEFDLIDFEAIMGWIEDNTIALIIIGALLGYFIVMRLRQTYDPQTKNVRGEWKALKRIGMKITNKLVCKVAVIGGGHFEISGDLYLIHSQVEDHCLIPKLNIQLPPTEGKENIPAEDLPGLMIPLEKETLTAQEVQALVKQIAENKRIWISRKTETYVALRKTPAGGEVVTFRMSGLREQQTIVSESAELPLMQIKPELMFETQRMVLVILGIFELILMYMMINNIDPSVLYDRGTWPWFIVFGAIIACREVILRAKIGFYMQTYSYLSPEESFKLRSHTGESLTHTSQVYDLRLLYHPQVRIDNTLDIDTDRLAELIDHENKKRVTALSTEVVTLEAKLDLFTELLNQKDQALDSMKYLSEQRFNDGLLEGITREQPFLQEPDLPRKQTDFLDWFRESKPIIFGIIIIAVVVIFFWGVMDTFVINTGSGGGTAEESSGLFGLSANEFLIIGILGFCLFVFIIYRLTKS